MNELHMILLEPVIDEGMKRQMEFLEECKAAICRMNTLSPALMGRQTSKNLDLPKSHADLS